MHHWIKIVLIGDPHVGKTSLIFRYIDGTFIPEYIATLGVDFINKVFTHRELKKIPQNMQIIVNIWDLAGQPGFAEITPNFLEGAAGVFIVFDMTDPISCNHVKDWVEKSIRLCPKAKIMIIGNKADLPSQITKEALQALKTSWNYPVHLTSAKENWNVTEIFSQMMEKIIENSRFKKQEEILIGQ